MPIRVTNLRVGLDEPDAALPERLARLLDVPADGLQWRILRKSLDTRDKHDIHFVFNAEVRLPDDEARVVAHARRLGPATVELYDEPPFALPTPGNHPLPHRPVVIGSGPGGLAAAYFLAERGYAPLVVERGPAVSDRFRCQVEDIDLRDGRLVGLMTSGGSIPCDVAILAIGHSARDTYAVLARRSVPLEQKAFQMGLRVEHPQAIVNRAQYGPALLED